MTWIALVALVGLGGTQESPATVTGQVVDATGLAIPAAVVTVRGTTTLTVSDAGGRFTIALGPGAAVLIVEMPGFRTKQVPVGSSSGNRTPLRIALEVSPIADEVTVRARVIASEPDARLPLRPLDIVRTAGAEADVMRALAVLPGVVQIDEGAGLFVRGGDVAETLVLLDSVPVRHPYRYETPTGGFRGSIDPFLTQGLSFTTGGFSAEYGNSLSAVVDMRGLTRPTTVRVNGTAGLAGVAATTGLPIGERAGVRFGVNRATPRLLFSVNPEPREFDRLPGGWDLSASADFYSASLGTWHGFVLRQRDHVGVELERDAFVGFVHSGTDHRLAMVTWQRAFTDGWSLAASGGIDRSEKVTDVGVLAISETDRGLAGRVDAGGPLGAWRVRAGAEASRVETGALGLTPARGGDFAGVSGTRLFAIAHDDAFTGGYGEVSRTFGRLTPTAGIRVDHFRAASATRADPRLNLEYDLSAQGRLRLAWGRYHQAPSPDYFDRVAGAHRLRPMSATHYIVGYERGRIEKATFFRAEAFVKTYRELPVDDDVLGYADTGYGHARGVDLFVRRVWHFIDVRASASVIDTARRWTPPSQQARYPLPSGTWTPDFSIPFLWQLVANVPLSRTVAAGLAWHQASGRPFTPAVDAIETPSGFEPVWGAINSDRLPRYARLDLSLSKTHTVGTRALLVLFASMNNALGWQNVFEYAYSADYRERRPASGAAPRTWYVGCSITR